MKTNPIAAAACALLSLCAPTVGHAQDRNIIVGIEVNSSPVAKAPLTSCLNRELRKFADVEVGEFGKTSNEFDISIIMLEPQARTGAPLGYALSVVVVSYLGSLADTLVPNGGPELNKFYATYERIEMFQLLTDSNLQSICTRTVAAIDAGPFEEMRQVYQTLGKSAKKKPKAK